MAKTSRPLFLVTNDDGIAARGLNELVQCAREFGDVFVVAPDSSYSAQSHAITLAKPLVVTEHKIDGAEAAFAVAGTPVDCVKLGYYELLPEPPTMILSGINHGVNTGASVHYSGTLGAAREAAMLGAIGIGFSLADFSKDADFGASLQIVKLLIEKAVAKQLNPNFFYNINIPKGEIRGIRACRMAGGFWREKATLFTDPFGTKRYWLEGDFVNQDIDKTDTDEHLLGEGYATITPCQIDVNGYEQISYLQNLLEK